MNKFGLYYLISLFTLLCGIVVGSIILGNRFDSREDVKACRALCKPYDMHYGELCRCDYRFGEPGLRGRK